MTEREWREASDLRRSRFGLGVVVVAAVVLRFWALGHGIPFAVGADEPEIVDRAVNMMKSGSFNPHFYDYPAFYIYLQTAVACARFITGALTGAWTSLDTAPMGAFYLWARAVTALFGVATVLLVYAAGLRWGARHALLAAGIMAVLPSHVRESHYVLTDVPLTFFVTLALVLSLRAHERASAGAFAWAGVAVGLAAGTKYNGALALVIPLLTCLMTSTARPSRLLCALATAAAAALAFLAAAPFTVLDLPGFLNGFARLAGQYRNTPPPPDFIWLLYLKYLRIAFGWPGMILAAAGLLLGLTRLISGPGRVRWAVVIAFATLYFAFISQQRIVYGRYILPILPTISILAATAVISGVSLLRRFEIPRAPRTALIVALTVAAIVPPAVQAIGFDRLISKRGTKDVAYDWILTNIPPKSTIVVETRGIVLPASFATSNLPQLRRHDVAHYRDTGIEYLVASSQAFGPYMTHPELFPREYADYMTLFGQTREVARFAPNDQLPGPELRVLKVRP